MINIQRKLQESTITNNIETLNVLLRSPKADLKSPVTYWQGCLSHDNGAKNEEFCHITKAIELNHSEYLKILLKNKKSDYFFKDSNKNIAELNHYYKPDSFIDQARASTFNFKNYPFESVLILLNDHRFDIQLIDCVQFMCFLLKENKIELIQKLWVSKNLQIKLREYNFDIYNLIKEKYILLDKINNF